MPEDNPSTPPDIAIRTMQDDIETVKAKKSATPKLVGTMPNIPRRQPKPSVVRQPEQIKPAPRKKSIAILVGTLLLVLGGSATVLYLVFFSEGEILKTIISPTVTKAAPIPGNASLILEYRTDTQTRRQAVADYWNSKTTTPGTTGSLLQGDPRIALQDNEVSAITYVLIEGNPRPFVILPAVGSIEGIVGSITSEQKIKKDGWWVIHPINPGELLQQSEANPYENPTFPQSIDFALKLTLSAEKMKELLPESTTGKPAGLDQPKTILVSNLQKIGPGIRFSGIREKQAAVQNPVSDKVASNIFSVIPNDVQGLYAAGSIQADSTHPMVNQAQISSPLAAQIMKSLGSYAYYTRLGADGLQDRGLVIEIAAPGPSLELGSSTLEEVLYSLVPLLTGSTSSTALAFSDAQINGIPLRYVNFGSQNQAIDYAIINNLLVVASSKEGIEAIIGNATAIPAPAAWRSEAERLLATQGVTHLTSQTIPAGDISQLLGENPQKPSAYVAGQSETDTSIVIEGVVLE